MELTTEQELANVKEELAHLKSEYLDLTAEYEVLYNDHNKTVTMLVQAKEVIKTMTNFIDSVVEEAK